MIGCEGATVSIEVGRISDGGILVIYVDDMVVAGDSISPFMFRNNGQAVAMAALGIDCIALDSNGNLCEENEPGRYYAVERVEFRNRTSTPKRIRIEPIDADYVSSNFTSANLTFNFDEDTKITTFCLGVPY